MRLSRNASATKAGTSTFIAQVMDGLPAAPNLKPAMKTTFFALRQRFDRRAVEQVAGDRLDAVRLQLLAQARTGEARDADDALLRAPPGAARRASVGPILPPTPRMRMSPSTASRSAISASSGVVITSSSISSLVMRDGRAAGMGMYCPSETPIQALTGGRRSFHGISGLQHRAERQDRRLVAIAAGELHADRHAVGGPVQRQRHGRLARHVEGEGEDAVGPAARCSGRGRSPTCPNGRAAAAAASASA